MHRLDPPKHQDAFEFRVIAEAVSYSAFQFRGRQSRTKREAATLESAREHAGRFLDEHPQRPVLIYAIDEKGRQALVETMRYKPDANDL